MCWVLKLPNFDYAAERGSVALNTLCLERSVSRVHICMADPPSPVLVFTTGG